jgi:hypothetical protein
MGSPGVCEVKISRPSAALMDLRDKQAVLRLVLAGGRGLLAVRAGPKCVDFVLQDVMECWGEVSYPPRCARPSRTVVDGPQQSAAKDRCRIHRGIRGDRKWFSAAGSSFGE